MPTYEVTDPTGKRVRVKMPAGATLEQAIQHVKERSATGAGGGRAMRFKGSNRPYTEPRPAQAKADPANPPGTALTRSLKDAGRGIVSGYHGLMARNAEGARRKAESRGDSARAAGLVESQQKHLDRAASWNASMERDPEYEGLDAFMTGDPNKMLRTVGYAVGQTLGYGAGALATGGAGGVIGGGVAALGKAALGAGGRQAAKRATAQALSRKGGDSLAKKLARGAVRHGTGRNVGRGAGVLGFTTAVETGHIYPAAVNTAKGNVDEIDLTRVDTAGAVAGALEGLGTVGAAATAGIGPLARAASAIGKGSSLAGRAVRRTAVGAAVEGPTEGMQEIVGNIGASEEDVLGGSADAAFMGAIGGGAVGGAGAVTNQPYESPEEMPPELDDADPTRLKATLEGDAERRTSTVRSASTPFMTLDEFRAHETDRVASRAMQDGTPESEAFGEYLDKAYAQAGDALPDLSDPAVRQKVMENYLAETASVQGGPDMNARYNEAREANAAAEKAYGELPPYRKKKVDAVRKAAAAHLEKTEDGATLPDETRQWFRERLTKAFKDEGPVDAYMSRVEREARKEVSEARSKAEDEAATAQKKAASEKQKADKAAREKAHQADLDEKSTKRIERRKREHAANEELKDDAAKQRIRRHQELKDAGVGAGARGSRGQRRPASGATDEAAREADVPGSSKRRRGVAQVLDFNVRLMSRPEIPPQLKALLREDGSSVFQPTDSLTADERALFATRAFTKWRKGALNETGDRFWAGEGPKRPGALARYAKALASQAEAMAMPDAARAILEEAGVKEDDGTYQGTKTSAEKTVEGFKNVPFGEQSAPRHVTDTSPDPGEAAKTFLAANDVTGAPQVEQGAETPQVEGTPIQDAEVVEETPPVQDDGEESYRDPSKAWKPTPEQEAMPPRWKAQARQEEQLKDDPNAELRNEDGDEMFVPEGERRRIHRQANEKESGPYPETDLEKASALMDRMRRLPYEPEGLHPDLQAAIGLYNKVRYAEEFQAALTPDEGTVAFMKAREGVRAAKRKRSKASLKEAEDALAASVRRLSDLSDADTVAMLISAYAWRRSNVQPEGKRGPSQAWKNAGGDIHVIVKQLASHFQRGMEAADGMAYDADAFAKFGGDMEKVRGLYGTAAIPEHSLVNWVPTQAELRRLREGEPEAANETSAPEQAPAEPQAAPADSEALNKARMKVEGINDHIATRREEGAAEPEIAMLEALLAEAMEEYKSLGGTDGGSGIAHAKPVRNTQMGFTRHLKSLLGDNWRRVAKYRPVKKAVDEGDTLTAAGLASVAGRADYLFGTHWHEHLKPLWKGMVENPKDVAALQAVLEEAAEESGVARVEAGLQAMQTVTRDLDSIDELNEKTGQVETREGYDFQMADLLGDDWRAKHPKLAKRVDADPRSMTDAVQTLHVLREWFGSEWLDSAPAAPKRAEVSPHARDRFPVGQYAANQIRSSLKRVHERDTPLNRDLKEFLLDLETRATLQHLDPKKEVARKAQKPKRRLFENERRWQPRTAAERDFVQHANNTLRGEGDSWRGRYPELVALARDGNPAHAIRAVDGVWVAEREIGRDFRDGHERLMKSILDPTKTAKDIHAEVMTRAAIFKPETIVERALARDLARWRTRGWVDTPMGRKILNYVRNSNVADKWQKARDIAEGKMAWKEIPDRGTNPGDLPVERSQWQHVNEDVRHVLGEGLRLGGLAMASLQNREITRHEATAIEHAERVFPVGWTLFPELEATMSNPARYDDFVMAVRQRAEQFHEVVDGNDLSTLVSWIMTSPGFKRNLGNVEQMKLMTHIVQKVQDYKTDDIFADVGSKPRWNVSQIENETGLDRSMVRDTLRTMVRLMNTNLGAGFVNTMFADRRRALRSNEATSHFEGGDVEESWLNESAQVDDLGLYGAPDDVSSARDEMFGTGFDGGDAGVGFGTAASANQGRTDPGIRARHGDVVRVAVEGGPDLVVELKKGERVRDPGDRSWAAAAQAERSALSLGMEAERLRDDPTTPEAEARHAMERADVAAKAAMELRAQAVRDTMQSLKFAMAMAQNPEGSSPGDTARLRRESQEAAAERVAESNARGVGNQQDAMSRYALQEMRKERGNEAEAAAQESRTAAARRETVSIEDLRSHGQHLQGNKNVRAYAREAWDTLMPEFTQADPVTWPKYDSLSRDEKAFVAEAVHLFRNDGVKPADILAQNRRVGGYSVRDVEAKFRWVAERWRSRVRGTTSAHRPPRGGRSSVKRRKGAKTSRKDGKEQHVEVSRMASMYDVAPDLTANEFLEVKARLRTAMDELIGNAAPDNVIVARHRNEAAMLLAAHARRLDPGTWFGVAEALAATDGTTAITTRLDDIEGDVPHGCRVHRLRGEANGGHGGRIFLQGDCGARAPESRGAGRLC